MTTHDIGVGKSIIRIHLRGIDVLVYSLSNPFSLPLNAHLRLVVFALAITAVVRIINRLHDEFSGDLWVGSTLR